MIMKYCTQCGQANQDEDRFCMKCGAKTVVLPAQENPTPPTPAPTPAAKMYFYIDENNQAVGPHTLGELTGLEGKGIITPSTLLASDGDQDWKPWRSLAPGAPSTCEDGERQTPQSLIPATAPTRPQSEAPPPIPQASATDFTTLNAAGIESEADREAIESLRAANQDAYAEIAQRYGGGESVEVAGVVFWNVIEIEAKKGGLADRAESGVRAKDLALGLALGPAVGVLASVMTDKNEPAKCTCELGIVAVGSSRVLFMELGRRDMIGTSEQSARLPAELLVSIPKHFKARKVAAFRPLAVTLKDDTLRVHILGNPHGQFDSAFEAGGACLTVRAPSTAKQIAAAISKLVAYPLPEKVMVSVLSLDESVASQQIETASEDPDYVRSFVHFFRCQSPPVRRAWILAARAASTGVAAMTAACAKSVGRGTHSPKFVSALGLFFSVIGAVILVIAVREFAAKSLTVNGDSVFSYIFFPACIHGGIMLLYHGFWRDLRARKLECHWLEDGGGFGGSLDSVLALLDWGKDWRARVQWSEVETAHDSNAEFGRCLSAILFGMSEARRKEFLLSTPPMLREKLVGTLLAFKGAWHSLAIRYSAVWLPCFLIGLYGAWRGFTPETPAVGAWMVYVFGWLLGLGGAISGVVLFIVLMTAWWKRRWLTKAFPTEASVAEVSKR